MVCLMSGAMGQSSEKAEKNPLKIPPLISCRGETSATITMARKQVLGGGSLQIAIRY